MRHLRTLEPIPNLHEQNRDGSELYEAEEVLSVALAADDETALPMKSRPEALHQPAAPLPAQDAAIL